MWQVYTKEVTSVDQKTSYGFMSAAKLCKSRRTQRRHGAPRTLVWKECTTGPYAKHAPGWLRHVRQARQPGHVGESPFLHERLE